MAPLRTERRTRPRTKPRRLAAVGAIVASFALVGCGGGSGFQAQTNQIYQPGPGITVRQPGMYLLNAAIVTDGEGNGTLVGALINQLPHPDSLTAVSVTWAGGRSLNAKLLTGKVALAPQTPVQFANTSTIRMSNSSLVAGRFYSLTLTFQNAAPITVSIPALPNSPEFADVKIGPLPGATS